MDRLLVEDQGIAFIRLNIFSQKICWKKKTKYINMMEIVEDTYNVVHML